MNKVYILETEYQSFCVACIKCIGM
uniref:Uncharacterized protein n=1 Tax=Anguilla anguilla TaxID=7936 RepID=A0A0E9PPJ4_ANGAN